jgi:hypothetical protein
MSKTDVDADGKITYTLVLKDWCDDCAENHVPWNDANPNTPPAPGSLEEYLERQRRKRKKYYCRFPGCDNRRYGTVDDIYCGFHNREIIAGRIAVPSTPSTSSG